MLKFLLSTVMSARSERKVPGNSKKEQARNFNGHGEQPVSKKGAKSGTELNKQSFRGKQRHGARRLEHLILQGQ